MIKKKPLFPGKADLKKRRIQKLKNIKRFFDIHFPEEPDTKWIIFACDNLLSKLNGK